MALVTFWAITVFVCGITIGSFLTAVIYRLGRPQLHLSLLEPKRSMCPDCKHSLGVLDLIPLFSFLLAGQKCRYCKKPISWRYFGVELLTGLTFVAVYLKFPQDVPTLVATLAFAAVLIPILFIDLETFMIPVSLNLLATVIPFARDAYGIALHQPGFDLIGGWLPRSLLGALIGTLIFGLVRIAGWLYKGMEAMGLGDVYLARGMGAMLMILMPASLAFWPFPLWVILSCVSGIVVYPVFVLLGRAGAQKNSEKKRDRYGNLVEDVELPQGASTKTDSTANDGAKADRTEVDETEADPGREGTLVDQLQDVGGVLIFHDAYYWVRYTFDRKFQAAVDAEEASAGEEDDWVPAPTAIPFGPFLVFGFLLTIFAGEAMILAYLTYAHLLPGTAGH